MATSAPVRARSNRYTSSINPIEERRAGAASERLERSDIDVHGREHVGTERHLHTVGKQANVGAVPCARHVNRFRRYQRLTPVVALRIHRPEVRS